MKYPVRRTLALCIAAALSAMALAACQGIAAPLASPTASPAEATAQQAEISAPTTPTPSPSPTPTPSPSPTPTESPTPSPTPKVTPKPTAKPYTLSYKIYVEKGSHTITVYGKDSKGNYTKVVKQFLTAIGRTSKATPTGTFHIGKKLRWKSWGTADHAQYASLYYGSTLYIHSVLYNKKNNNTLQVSSYREIGGNYTAGCLRTSTYAAYWIYTYCKAGTEVKIVNGSPKDTHADPLPAIPDDATYDPTDPDPPPPPTASPTPTLEPSPTPSAMTEE